MKTGFTAREFVRICDVLRITPDEVFSKIESGVTPPLAEIEAEAENMAVELDPNAMGATSLHFRRLDVSQWAAGRKNPNAEVRQAFPNGRWT